MAKDLAWTDIADKTENYTGADLKALLSNAQLESIHSKLDHFRASMLRVDASPANGATPSFSRFKLADTGGGEEALSSEQRSNVLKKVEIIRDNLLSSDPAATAEKRVAHDVPEILQTHILKALAELVPSISAAERRRYQQIYSSFLQSRGADFQDSTAALQNQRQTLA